MSRFIHAMKMGAIWSKPSIKPLLSRKHSSRPRKTIPPFKRCGGIDTQPEISVRSNLSLYSRLDANGIFSSVHTAHPSAPSESRLAKFENAPYKTVGLKFHVSLGHRIAIHWSSLSRAGVAGDYDTPLYD